MPLLGRTIKAATNGFGIALSPADSEKQRNLKLLTDEAWLEILIVYDDGLRAALVLEKGAAGGKAIADALAAWK
jgi:hypothetical protein